ncbi:hypothetical protein DFA_11008 [Cavenderia fasciculata]|uniref:Uncharacterized protein n=1 Tax=Cavenderia fasciculata TaxID=261658 RepID=F4QC10_CACFS|nr:uncharacterized protein DFA_11008 [Cavenderia fasciculata]EGG14748.1 hypothetical protein DFA_11008 [Cavenderia fasciculata]|eukprot:XP_004351256.1 hypothetical protein DFA_11008 [Cavenderia fasciculata]
MQHNNILLKDYSQGVLEYCLPWFIIARILKEACETIDICTCVYKGIVKSTLCKDKSKRWKRSLGLVSKRVFLYVSTTLFTNIVLEPFDDDQLKEWWNHIKDDHCIIKKVTTLTILPGKSFTKLKDLFNHYSSSSDSSTIDLLCGVEKLHYKGTSLTRTDNLDELTNALPNLKSIVHYSDTNINTITTFFTRFINLTSINLLCTSYSSSDFLHQIPTLLLLKPGTRITKIILPEHFDWDLLDKGVKQNLQVVSSMYPDFNQDFSSLRHIVYIRTFLIKQAGISVPQSARKVTFTTHKQGLIASLADNSHIQTVRFKNISNYKYVAQYDRLDLEIIQSSMPIRNTIKRIIIDSSVNILESNVIRFKELGYEYLGSTISNTSFNKLQFKLIQSQDNNHISLCNKYNYLYCKQHYTAKGSDCQSISRTKLWRH